MSKQERTETRIRTFSGLALGTDPHDLEPGQAVEQVNVVTSNDGEMQTRKGFRFVRFEDD